MQETYTYGGWTVKLTRKGAAWCFNLIRNGHDTGGGFAPNEEIARRYAEDAIDAENAARAARAERCLG